MMQMSVFMMLPKRFSASEIGQKLSVTWGKGLSNFAIFGFETTFVLVLDLCVLVRFKGGSKQFPALIF